MNKVPRISVVFESAEMHPVVNYKKLENGQIEFTGILQTVDSINRNANDYPRDVLAEALATPRIAELVRRRAWFGEIAHPYQRKDFNRSVDIFPKLVSHRICEIPHFVGDQVQSLIHTVAPEGSTVVSWVVDEGSQLGFSMRGLTPYTITKTTPVQHKVVKSPMNIITYDIVFYPSHAEALMMEGGVEKTPAYECTYEAADIASFVTEESVYYKIFRDELGIELDASRGVQKVSGESALTGALKDGRLVKLELEDSIIADVARYL